MFSEAAPFRLSEAPPLMAFSVAPPPAKWTFLNQLRLPVTFTSMRDAACATPSKMYRFLKMLPLPETVMSGDAA